MTRKSKETKAKHLFKEHFSGFISFVEHKSGATEGNPDSFIIPSGLRVMLPLEFKDGRIVGNRIFPEEVRASQVAWCRRCRGNGVAYMIVVGIEGEELYFVDGEYIKDWRSGWKIGRQAVKIFPSSFTLDYMFRTQVYGAMASASGQ